MKSTFKKAILSSMMIGSDSSLLTVYATAEEIPENFSSLYTKGEDGKYNLTGVVGLKTQDDINRLQGALDKERNDHKTVKSTLARLGDRSIDDVLTALDSIPALEAQIKEGTTDEDLINARIAQATAPIDREKKALQGQFDSIKEELVALKTKVMQDAITSKLKHDALANKVLPEAIDDVAMLGLSLFEQNEAGEIIAKSDSGITAGIAPAVWLNDLKRTKPFYWPASQNAGGRGNNGNGGGGSGNNPWAKGNVNLTEQGRLIRNDPELARQFAKQAGIKPTW